MIQHADINVGPASYRAMKEDELLVTNIFYTIQGEGPWAGCPAMFIRLAGCNRGRKEDMGCKFCDTRFYFAEGKAMTFDDIRREITSKGMKAQLTVITGGEPMMQDNLSKFVQFHRMAFPGRSIQIESNGDRIAQHWPMAGYASIVVSPKISKHGYIRLKPEVMKAAMCLKFVVSADPESPYYDIPEWAFEFKLDRVFVSPMTVYLKQVERSMLVSAWDATLIDRAATRMNYRRAAALALKKGVRISTQQHLFYEVE